MKGLVSAVLHEWRHYLSLVRQQLRDERAHKIVGLMLEQWQRGDDSGGTGHRLQQHPQVAEALWHGVVAVNRSPSSSCQPTSNKAIDTNICAWRPMASTLVSLPRCASTGRDVIGEQAQQQSALGSAFAPVDHGPRASPCPVASARATQLHRRRSHFYSVGTGSWEQADGQRTALGASPGAGTERDAPALHRMQ